LLEFAQLNRSPVPSGGQLGAEQEPVPCVHVEQAGGGASRCGHTNDLGTQPGEVVVPLLLAWVEEGHRAAGVRIDAVEIRSLVQVAAVTSEAEI
jgi:hypothetical protein